VNRAPANGTPSSMAGLIIAWACRGLVANLVSLPLSAAESTEPPQTGGVTLLGPIR
jgi:hypothetical protein